MVNLHHAIVFEGDRAVCMALAQEYVQDVLELSLRGNPDVQIIANDQFAIGDANRLKEHAMQAPMGRRQVFLLAFDRVTGDAQNALLKLLEEPAHDTHFVLLVPSMEILLQTIRSRVAYGGRAVGSTEEDMLAQRFLTGSIEQRISLVSPLYKGVKDDEKLAVRTRARAIVHALEKQLHREGVRAHAEQLRAIAFVRGYIGDPSASLKMLLEHLVYTV